MMMHKMCGVHKAGWCLLIIGGLNWLLVGLLGKDLFVLLNLGMGHWLARVVYVLVGLSAVAALGIGKCCGKCNCGGKDCKECGPKSEMPAAMPPKA